MARTEVTTSGFVDISTTPVVHVAIISTKGGTGDTVMETSPGMRLPAVTLAMERQGSPDRSAREASTSRTTDAPVSSSDDDNPSRLRHGNDNPARSSSPLVSRILVAGDAGEATDIAYGSCT